PVLALGKYGFISDVYVVDSYRKKGISKQLISKLYLWFEKNGINLVELSIHIKNKGAIKTWGKAGFQPYMIKYYKKI
ncbi:MAG: GNAT family N-acetyltransferase, partial [Nanoarchaeota archaeon]|nr:GNAT family N-acetyltransferase [Nanoarchaeota archaeon]